MVIREDNEMAATISPFNDDIDFRLYTPGFISYREDSTPEILTRATDAVMAIRQYAQELPDFQTTWTLIVTWHEAVKFGSDATAVSLKITLEVGQHFLYLKNGSLS